MLLDYSAKPCYELPDTDGNMELVLSKTRGIWIYSVRVVSDRREWIAMMENQSYHHAYLGKCDVCGAHGPVYLRCSSMGPFSFSYCKRCIQSGAEPYWFTVSTVDINGLWPDDVNEPVQHRIRGILHYLNRSEDAFKRDVYRSYHYMLIQNDS